MMGANIAPGMHREFQAQNWDNIVSPKLFARGFEEAESLVDTSVEMDIQGYDIDPQIVKAARENAKRVGVDGLIHFQQRPVHHSVINLSVLRRFLSDVTLCIFISSDDILRPAVKSCESFSHITI